MKKYLLVIGSFVVLMTNAQELSVIKRRKALQENLNKFNKETQKFHSLLNSYGQVPPNKYFEQDYKLTMNPLSGEVNREQLKKVWQELKKGKFRAKQEIGLLSSSRNLEILSSSVNNKLWTERGPYEVGGRTRAIMFDPNDATGKKVFAGGVSGGLWVNNDITDPNSEWTPVNDFWENTSVVCMAFDPNDTHTFYVGTGESCTYDNVGSGIWKTTDGGQTWTNIFTKPVSYLEDVRRGNFYINDIKVRNNNGVSEVYVGVSGGYNEGFQGLYDAGLYKSVDGGQNFSKVSSLIAGNNVGYSIQQIEIAVDNSVWVSTRQSMFGSSVLSGGKVFKSEDGINFTNIYDASLPNSRVNFALSKQNANKAYVLMEGYGTTEPVRILKTVDGGTTWLATNDANATITLPDDPDTGIDANDFTRGQAFYDLVIATDPDNDEVVYTGGINIHKSTDGAATWNTLTKWHSSIALDKVTMHADQHAIVFNPANSSQILFGNDGGIYFTSDKNAIGASTGIEMRNKRYNVTQFYDAAINPVANPANEEIIAGAQDNGTQALSGTPLSNNFYEAYEYTGGDGGQVAYDDENQYVINGYVYNNHYLYSYPANKFVYLLSTKTKRETTGHFINEIGVDKNLDIFYSYNAGLKLHRVSGLKSNPLKLVEGTVTVGTPASGEEVSKIAVSPYTTTSTKLFVGSNIGNLYKVVNANTTKPTSTKLVTPFVGSISDIEFGTSEDNIIVTLPNYGSDVSKVYYTTDGGQTWLNKHGNLPDMPVRCAFMNPENINEVLLGTELGIWGTTNFQSATPTWVQYSNGLGNVRVTNIDYRPSTKTLLASTYGRGVFTSVNEDVGLSIKETNTLKNNTRVYPNPSRGELHLQFNEQEYHNVKVLIYDGSGRLVYTQNGVKNGETFYVNLPKGVYVLSAESQGKVFYTSTLIIK
ncbi:T9SS type A sorting domain-containing protein [Riemerella anatipestifer]|nr:T9SS type A sorting domain-containing protein [Riemerella anatipestifer]